MEQQTEYTEHTLEQEILRLKAEGKSIREIAEAVGKPPTTIHRLLAKMEQSEGDEDKSGAQVEHPQGDLTLSVARVLDSDNEEAIASVLRRVEEAEDQAAQVLREARAREADAERHLQDAAQRAALARDAVDRAQTQEAAATAKADLVEAHMIAATREREHGELHSLLTRLQARKRELHETKVEREIQELVQAANEKLTALQQAFIGGVHEVQVVLDQARQRAEQAGMPAMAKDLEIRAPLEHRTV